MRKANVNLPKVIIRSIAIVLSVFLIQLPIYAMAQELRLMTRNLYIGAEIQSLAAAETPEDFIAGVQVALEQIAANNFRERAVALAAEIVEKKVKLVGLQEVYRLTSSIDGLNSEPPFLDYLDELLNELTLQGACYYAAATVTNLDFGPIPTPLYGFVSITDRDVILARCDIESDVVNLTGFCPHRQSMDGCNYQVVALAQTPVGPIAFQRGFVGIDTIYGRFFNTHLEVRNPDPSNPLSPLVQRFQAQELLIVLNLINSIYPPAGPTIIVGDINSSSDDTGSIMGLESPYMQLADVYYDTWTLRPGKPQGYTCCFDEDLSIDADLYERIDMIFTSEFPDRVKANVVGNDEEDQSFSGLWPTDHAGVVARIKFAP